MMGLSRPIINEKTGGEVATYLYYHTHPPGGLQRYYADNVIGGPGAFALQIVNFDAFANAMTEKLMMEISLLSSQVQRGPQPSLSEANRDESAMRAIRAPSISQSR
jgi:hypothetical protein